MLGRTLLSVLFAANVFAQTAPHALTAELEKIRKPVVLKDGRLTGAGAELLQKELASTQFFLIGEEHGTAEVARLTTALLPEAWKNGYRHVAMEVGPHSLPYIDSLEAIEKFDAKYRWSYPFLNWKEEAELYAAAMKLGEGKRDTVWGVDQEFVLFATPHLERLVALAKNDAQRAVATKLLERSRAGEEEMFRTKSPAKLLMLSASAAEFEELRNAFGGGDAEALRLIDAMEESRQIYQLGSVSGWGSNDQRAHLIKRLFSESYANAVARGEAKPKVIVKMGATHTMRGRSMTGVFDLGSMLPELATVNGTRSFSLLVIPRGGFTNEHRPFSPNTEDKRAPYDPKKLPFDGKPLFDAASASEWSLFDLRAIRGPLARKKLDPMDERLRNVLWGYDAVLIIPEATPATLFH
ncbi:MAG TPA: hypothetical protein VF846_12155 [Thermoanaerobaculia bacterium]|jgi:hypothetical protein